MKNDTDEDAAIIIFIKNPVLGKVKTRLAATIGEQAALDVYWQLIACLKNGVKGTTNPIYIYYSDYIEPDDGWPVRRYFKEVQSGKDLGERMSDALSRVLSSHQKAVLIGSDCPMVDMALLQRAIRGFDKADVVIGPSPDGGYYLIGMKNHHDALFRDISWSTRDVLNATLEQAEKSSVSVHLLPELRDVDDESDFLYYVKRGILSPIDGL